MLKTLALSRTNPARPYIECLINFRRFARVVVLACVAKGGLSLTEDGPFATDSGAAEAPSGDAKSDAPPLPGKIGSGGRDSALLAAGCADRFEQFLQRGKT